MTSDPHRPNNPVQRYGRRHTPTTRVAVGILLLGCIGFILLAAWWFGR